MEWEERHAGDDETCVEVELLRFGDAWVTHDTMDPRAAILALIRRYDLSYAAGDTLAATQFVNGEPIAGHEYRLKEE